MYVWLPISYVTLISFANSKAAFHPVFIWISISLSSHTSKDQTWWRGFLLFWNFTPIKSLLFQNRKSADLFWVNIVKIGTKIQNIKKSPSIGCFYIWSLVNGPEPSGVGRFLYMASTFDHVWIPDWPYQVGT